MELRQVETLLVGTRVELAALRRQAAQNEALLAQLTGYTAGQHPPPAPLTDQGLERELQPGLPAELLTRRPDIRAAEQRLAASRASVRAARAAFFPNITLTGFAGTASAELDGLFRGGSASWSFTPALRLPLFDGGRNRANLELAEARRDVAVADYEALVQAAFRDAWGWDWRWGSSLIFGLSLSCASTVVLLKVLESRGVLESMNGRIAVGWLVVEDLATVLVLVLLPPLAGVLGGSETVQAAAAKPLWITIGQTLL